MAIEFHSEELDFRLSNQKQVHAAIERLVVTETFDPGDINLIFCSDAYLLQVNQEYLQHDYYTDIITFNYNEGNQISGDLFISVDRVRENALVVGVSFENELNRVVLHGVLHLIGYNDKTDEEIVVMRSKEENYLKLF